MFEISSRAVDTDVDTQRSWSLSQLPVTRRTDPEVANQVRVLKLSLEK